MKIDDLPNLRGVGSGIKVIPEVLYIGRTECNWPIVAFESPVHAQDWLQGRSESTLRRHLYRLEVRTGEVTEMVLTEPVTSQLVEKPPDPGPATPNANLEMFP